MKLGDNMTMEACNVWGDVCSRKCRPPRIGDIPRHGAVDEESPGSSTNKLTEAISKYDPRKNLLVVLEKDEHQGQSPPGTANLHDLYFMRQDTNETSLDKGYMRSDTILAKSTSPVGRDAKGLETDESRVTIRLTAMSVEDSRQGTLKASSPGESPRIPSSPDDLPDDEILEVRKDSALFLEEAEGLPTLREILKSRGPTFVRPRRESSGYSSTLGTFDEDRRNSSAGGEAQQDLSSLLKERRRSSRLISKLPACRAEESLGEESFNIGAPGSNERMPPGGDQLRKLSSSGLEMPNIEEVREVVKEETPSAARSAREGLNELCHLVENVSVEVSSDCCLPGDHPSNHTNLSENGDQGRWPAREYLSTAMISGEPSAARVPGGPFDGTSPTKVVGPSRMDLPSATISPRSTSRSNWDSNPGSRSVQQSVDALTTMTLEITACVTAKNSSVDKSWEIDRNTSLEAKLEPHLLAESRLKEDEDLERCSPTRARSNIVHSDATLLPRTVKVYQLLSTQSEDQGDIESHLTDRRISLQMSRQENNERLSMDVSGTTNDKSCDLRMILRDPSKIDGPSELGKISDRRVATDESAASTPVRKLSSPGEVGPTQKFLGDAAGTSVALGGRPIYPYCPYSPYGSPQGSPRNRRRPLRESRRVSIDNRQGALQLNQYKLLDNIGQGSYGIVKLAYNEEDGIHYAMKILSKKKLMKKAGIFGRMAPGKKGAANPLAKVYREIALLKKLDHPNVVKLVEVLDDPDEDNLYLVFELVQRGEVLQIPTDKPLDEDTARKNFRDVVMGVEYLHYQRIVHRDIKPSNLLLDSEGRIKIADLGVSAELRASGELLSGPAGTPAFAAPETTTPGAHYSGTLCDVWSMGVTLYSMVTGRLPWDGAGSIIGVQAAVRSEPLKFPEKPDLSENLRDIIVRMLAKDPLTRITLQGMKEHDWLTDHGMEPLPTEVDNCRLPVTVTDEEVERVVTRVPKLDTLILIKTMLKQHSFQNPFLPKRIGRSVCNDGESGSSESSSRSSGESLAHRDAAPRNLKTERFHRTGRSNSAPDSYDWQANGRQISVESPLPPVTEASSQEAEIERR